MRERNVRQIPLVNLGVYKLGKKKQYFFPYLTLCQNTHLSKCLKCSKVENVDYGNGMMLHSSIEVLGST